MSSKKNKNKGKNNTQNDKDISALQESAEEQGINLPDQSHCTWLLNIIQLHARNIDKEEIDKQDSKTYDQLKRLTEDIQNLREDLETMHQRAAKQQRKLDRLEYENTSFKCELKKVHLKLDELEQGKLKNCVQIVGLPDSVEKDDMKQVIKITKEKLGIKIKTNDISEMSRLGKTRAGKIRHLNVTFRDTEIREKVFLQRKELITERTPTKNIYINDCLTKHRQNVLFSCRKQVRAKKLFAAWSQGGNVLIRKEQDGNVIQVFDHEDLREPFEDALPNGVTETSDVGNMSVSTRDES